MTNILELWIKSQLFTQVSFLLIFLFFLRYSATVYRQKTNFSFATVSSKLSFTQAISIDSIKLNT